MRRLRRARELLLRHNLQRLWQALGQALDAERKKKTPASLSTSSPVLAGVRWRACSFINERGLAEKRKDLKSRTPRCDCAGVGAVVIQPFKDCATCLPRQARLLRAGCPHSARISAHGDSLTAATGIGGARAGSACPARRMRALACSRPPSLTAYGAPGHLPAPRPRSALWRWPRCRPRRVRAAVRSSALPQQAFLLNASSATAACTPHLQIYAVAARRGNHRICFNARLDCSPTYLG